MTRTVRRPLRRATAWTLPLVLLGAGLSLVTAGTSVPAAAAGPTSRCDAVEPTSGVVYTGAYGGSTLVLHGSDAVTHRSVGAAVRVRVPDAPGRDGDFTFDRAGHLYVAASSRTRVSVYVASLPISGSETATVTATKVRTSSVAGAVTGVAFASDGSLYASTAHTVQRVDPSTGVLGAAQDLGVDDPGSCSAPAALEQESVPPSPSPSPAATPAPKPSTASSPSPRPTPTPSPTQSETPKPSASPMTRSGVAAAAPALSVSVSATPATTTRTDQQVTYAVVVRNTGDAALRNLVVSAVTARLSALACAPVAQGATLGVGASTTCTGNRTTDQAYLSTYGERLTAVARGTSPDGTTVTGTGDVRTTTSALPPKVTDDSVTVVYGTSSVALPGSSNDSPGETGGPVIDRAAAFFPDGITTTGKRGSTEDSTFYGSWQALEDGTVRFLPTGGGTTYPGGFTESVRYTTVDTAGHRTTGTLTVTMRPGPVARDDTATTTQGDPVEVKPLANDTPGVTLTGQRAPFVVSSLRFPTGQQIEGVPVGDAQVAADGRSMTIPDKGTFTIVGDTIRFVPAPTFIDDFAISYTVTDGVLNRVRAQVSFTAQLAEPKLVDDSAVTTYDRPVSLAGVENDTPGIPGHTLRFAGFVDAGHTFTGPTLVTPEGTWSYAAYDGRPVFQPADGFSGVAHAGYAVDEVTAAGTVLGTARNFLGVWGGRYTAGLTATVRQGPSARTAVLSTPHDAPGAVDPTRSATPSTHLDGTPGRFVPALTVFTDAGQPAGSRVTDAGKTLVLATAGRLSVSASTGRIAYTPSPGFVGFAGTVAYRLEDDTTASDGRGETVSGRLAVLATGAVPVATDDDESTTPGAPVRLAGATNDDRGTTGAALTVDLAVGGQPAGSTVGSGGQSLTVPDEGTWSVGTDGSVSFTPVSGFVDGTSPVTYRVRSSAGTASAHLSVTTQRGAAARPSVITLPQLYSSWVDPITDDVAGRNADGTLGTIDRASLTFATTGQPAGATVSADGDGISVPAQGGLPAFGASVYEYPRVGAIIVSGGSSSFRGTLPAVRYSVQAITRDSTGRSVRSTISSTFRVRFSGRDPIATDDAATVASGATATLAAATNDTASAPGTGVSGPEFPEDQLGDLPPGSTTGRHCYDPEDGCQYYDLFVRVPGEGYWQTTYLGTVTFTPERGFAGTTTSVRYRIGDDQGSAEALLTVTVLPPGTVRPDVVSTPQGVPVTVDVLANDTPARAPDGTVVAPVDPDGVPFGYITRQPKGSYIEDASNFRTLVVPREGRYRIEYGTGRITFTPDPAYRGWTSSVYFRLTGSPNSPADEVITRFQVHVDHVVPTAAPDEATTSIATPVRVAVLDDDDPGTLRRPLVPSSVRLRSTPGLPSGSSVSSAGQLLTVAGRGTFAVAGDGTLTFYPLPGWTGTLPPVRYDVADANGTRALSTVTVRVKG